MKDQAFELKKTYWEQEHAATYISIASGKGGVGKTSFVVNLAFWLAHLKKRVLVFDADLGLANIDIMLSLSVSASVDDYLAGDATLDDIIIRNIYGFDVLPASSGMANFSQIDSVDFNKIVDIFIRLDKAYDYILFDNGAGISDRIMQFSVIADQVIVITNPEPTAITDAYAFMKLITRDHHVSKISLVMNRVDTQSSSISIYESLRGVVKRFLNLDLEFLGNVREDFGVRRAARSQKPISALDSGSVFARDTKEIAHKITGTRYNKDKVGISSMLRRIMK